MFRGRIRNIHFVGVGGVGMSGIAEVLVEHEFRVTGSDLRDNEYTRRLKDKGAQVFIGHRAEHIESADVVVYSSAVPKDNPELAAARMGGVPVIRRAEMLGELMRLQDGIAIAGSHGKTTTTSLTATVLRDAGLDPTVVIGGRLNALGSGATRGGGDLLVAEADESDGSFLHLTPAIAVITNIDPEHLDHYGSLAAVKDTFVAFANRVPFYGLVVACLDNPNVQNVIPRIEKRISTYGLTAQADYRARDPKPSGLNTTFFVEHHGRDLGEFVLPMPGMHNVLNALATIAVADELQVPMDKVRQGLSSFGGVQRRFTVVGEYGGITLVDDYGHHPTEIRVTLEAASRAFSGRRIVVAFQPHRYSRTHNLFEDLAMSFNRADKLFISDVYEAGEKPIEGADSASLARAIAQHGHHDVHYVGDRASLNARVLEEAQAGDVIVTLGAGDITKTAPELAKKLGSG